MNNVLFLDFDGVMNDMTFNPISQSFTILPRCVDQLNRILLDTNCKLVIISSWRYMILMGSMMMTGFENMLRTHGIAPENRVLDITAFDIKGPNDRGMLIQQWMQNNRDKIRNYCILDDAHSADYQSRGLKFVKTEKRIGLTQEEANRVILILTGRS